MSQTQNWRTIELLLGGVIFSIMGLELIGIVDDVRERHGSIWFAVGLGAAAATLVLVIRSVYVLGVLILERRRRRSGEDSREHLEKEAEQAAQRDDDRGHHYAQRRAKQRVAEGDYLSEKRLGARRVPCSCGPGCAVP